MTTIMMNSATCSGPECNASAKRGSWADLDNSLLSLGESELEQDQLQNRRCKHQSFSTAKGSGSGSNLSDSVPMDASYSQFELSRATTPSTIGRIKNNPADRRSSWGDLDSLVEQFAALPASVAPDLESITETSSSTATASSSSSSSAHPTTTSKKQRPRHSPKGLRNSTGNSNKALPPNTSGSNSSRQKELRKKIGRGRGRSRSMGVMG